MFRKKKLDSQHLLIHYANYENLSLVEIYLFLYIRLPQYFYKIGIPEIRNRAETCSTFGIK